MKKVLFAVAMAAVMLTGCGNTATSSGSTADTDLKTERTSAAVSDNDSKENVTDSQQSSDSEEIEYYKLNSIDFPIPYELDRGIISGAVHYWYTKHPDDEYTPLENVYYALDVCINDEYQNETNGYTVEDLPEIMLEYLNNELYVAFGSKSDNKAVESQNEEQFMETPALCEKGVITLDNEQKVNYIIHYFFNDYDTKEKHIPTFWVAFTASEDKDAIDLMNKAADLPLTHAKLHNS